SIELAIHRSTSSKRIGALTFNPGGPGEAALPLAAAIRDGLPASVRNRFDFVAWDPRGIGLSEPQLDNCIAPRAEPYALPPTGPVDWARATQETHEALAQVNAACLAANPDVAPYLGTYYVIRDLEAMRIALGERQWNFWGMSYGTRIGFRYAQEYPTRLRTLVLDGSWAPNLTVRSWMNGESWNYYTGKTVFSSLFGKKLAYRLQKVIDGLDERTITVEGTELTRWEILPEIFTNISYQTSYPDVLEVITDVYKVLYKKDQAAAARLPRLLKKLSARAEPNPNAGLTITFVNCRDMAGYPTIDEIVHAAEVSAANSTVFGGATAVTKGAFCAGLPDDFAKGYTPLIDNLTLPTPPVVVNSLGDTRTQYLFGRTMANFMAGSSLITYNSTQHVSYRQVPSSCISNAVTDYLITQDQPGNLLCPYAPLPPPPPPS
ncbi:MAG: hypothetical protein B7C55_08490, partial [Actinomycetales bacterium mxb001]